MSSLPPIRRDIQKMSPYKPIFPFDRLSEKLGIPPSRLIKLDANENPYGTLPAIKAALKNLPYTHIYPDPESRRLRHALSQWIGIPEERILAGAGADDLIDLILRLLLEPGDSILNCPPTFGMYAFDTALNFGKIIEVPRREDFSLDIQSIVRVVEEEHPKAIFLASPNNPDGRLLSSEEFEHLLSLPLYVVLDEAYIEFAPKGSSRIRETSNRENLIILRTFSKWGGLAGLRAGYGIFPEHLLPHLWKIKQPYALSVAAENAALAALEHTQELQEIGKKIISERKRLYQALQNFSWIFPFPSKANFILCRIDTPVPQVRKGLHLKEYLAKQGILVRYFDTPKLQNYVRISVGTPQDTDSLIGALEAYAAENRKIV